ncbi:MAG: excinuclease ABC subunit UvrA [Acidobacteriota bacterium]
MEARFTFARIPIVNDAIIVRGAREHNLKNITTEIPRNRLVVITGVSGSGKSSLAFDTLFAEGQRRYVESLSAYARQFLQQMEKPDVDAIDGLSPAISIEQKSVSNNPRSTVGTVTEIYDYLRLLYAAIGVPYCPDCGKRIEPQSIQQMVDRILTLPAKTKLVLYAPFIRGKKGAYKKQLEQMVRDGFIRARIDGQVVDLSEGVPELDKKRKHTIDVVIDRLVIKDGLEQRLSASLETALKVGDGLVILAPQGAEEETLSQHYACAECGFSVPEITPRLFSFNSPYGACETCGGLGTLTVVDPDKVIVDPKRSINAGAVAPWRPGTNSFQMRKVETLAETLGFSLDTPWNKLPESIRRAMLHGYDEEMTFTIESERSSYAWQGTFEGLIPRLERRHKETDSAAVRNEIEKYMSVRTCASCGGRRLRREALAVKVDEHPIDALIVMPIRELLPVVDALDLSSRDRTIAAKVLQEIRDRLGFLADVGVGYLTLDRASGTLSGGESQRIRLATQIGSKLMGVLYVLDEPSIGLHQRDNERLIRTLQEMRDLGNSVLVVEHDEDTIRAADWVLDLGPGAGVHGGEIVAEGPPEDLARHPRSLTGRYLRGDAEVALPPRRAVDKKTRMLTVRGARHNNLRNIDAPFALGRLNVVTGVSGSGKSSLVNDILHRALAKHFYRASADPGEHTSITGLKHLDKVIAIDQTPIGRTPRSNPATYTNVFNHIRTLMAKTPEARVRGYKPGRFSFNVKGGRCEACGGDGQIKIEMHFLPDIYVTCDICGGKRYNRETLNVRYKGLNIADILDGTVEQALDWFADIPAIQRILSTLNDVGLGYIKLGQPATTLSGGEAQRVKLATELCKRSTGRTLYLLDEPTTGLHFDDVHKLLTLLQRLVDKGNTVIVVEHNLDIVKSADWVIDLGPEGGSGGGQLIAAAPPETIAEAASSHTGAFLAPILARHRARTEEPAATAAAK